MRRPVADHLWLVGDLVNCCPSSLETLRYVRDLGPIGGIHEKLLAVGEGGEPRLGVFKEPVFASVARDHFLVSRQKNASKVKATPESTPGFAQFPELLGKPGSALDSPLAQTSRRISKGGGSPLAKVATFACWFRLGHHNHLWPATASAQAPAAAKAKIVVCSISRRIPICRIFLLRISLRANHRLNR